MEDAIFKTAVAAVASGDYCESDIKTIKDHLKFLNKQELTLKRQIEKETNEFVKNKDKHQTELKNIRNDIKELKHLLKTILLSLLCLGYTSCNSTDNSAEEEKPRNIVYGIDTYCLKIAKKRK